MCSNRYKQVSKLEKKSELETKREKKETYFHAFSVTASAFGKTSVYVYGSLRIKIIINYDIDKKRKLQSCSFSNPPLGICLNPSLSRTHWGFPPAIWVKGEREI